jgi:Leucine-rich repeat (LRR) protein
MQRNQLTSLTPMIGLLTCLTRLHVGSNKLTRLPREIGRLRSLQVLSASHNLLSSLPPELGNVPLRYLALRSNRLSWIPMELDQLSSAAEVFLCDNELPLHADRYNRNARPHLGRLIVGSGHIGTIRGRVTDVCVGLQSQGLPAFVTLQIVDALLDNDVRMWAKWELITSVKHFRERHNPEPDFNCERLFCPPEPRNPRHQLTIHCPRHPLTTETPPCRIVSVEKNDRYFVFSKKKLPLRALLRCAAHSNHTEPHIRAHVCTRASNRAILQTFCCS